MRDVARIHVLAFEKRDVAAGTRFIASAGTISLLQMAAALKKDPALASKFWLPRFLVPKRLFWLVGPLFKVSRKFVEEEVGIGLQLDASPSIKVLGLQYTPMDKTMCDMGRSLVANKVV